MTKPRRPRPIRLTQKRALALLEAAQAGLDLWDFEIRADLSSADLDVQREAKALDLMRADAMEAMTIVHDRYLGPITDAPQPRLFEG